MQAQKRAQLNFTPSHKDLSLLETHLAPPCVRWGYVQWVGQPQNSEGVKFHICLGGEGEGTGGWPRCTHSHMEAGLGGKLPVTRSTSSITCRFSVLELQGGVGSGGTEGMYLELPCWKKCVFHYGMNLLKCFWKTKYYFRKPKLSIRGMLE